MVTDDKLTFCEAQAVTVAVASTKYLDFQEVQRLGLPDLMLVGTVTETFEGLDSGIQFLLESDPANTKMESGAAGVNKSIDLFGVQAAADLVAGKQLAARLPLEQLDRYVRMYHKPVDEAATAGKVTWRIAAGADLV
jgi:hypothetical protein